MLRRHPSRVTLMALYDGELAGPEAQAVAEHADGCPRCGHWLEQLGVVGAVVRGDVVPAVAPPRARRPGPLAVRALAAASAVAAVALGFALNEPGGRDAQRVAADRGTVTTVAPAASPSTPPRGAPGPGPGDRPGATTTTGRPAGAPSQVAAPPAPSAPSPTGEIALGVLVPGGQAGPGERIVHAVAAELAQANAAGGAGGRSLRLVVGDANDPSALDTLVAQGAVALVGGVPTSPDTYGRAAARQLPWLAPAGVTGLRSPWLVPVELPFDVAGRVLALRAKQEGRRRVLVIRASAPEQAFGDGVAQVFGTATRSVVLRSANCLAELQETGTAAMPDLVALALPPEAVGPCVEAMASFPAEVLVPVTSAEVVPSRAHGMARVRTLLGAPPPDDPANAGAARFRLVTGVADDYRALVSFAAVDMAVEALRRDPGDVMGGLRSVGVYRSDLLTIDLRDWPMNKAPRPVELRGGRWVPAPGG